MAIILKSVFCTFQTKLELQYVTCMGKGNFFQIRSSCEFKCGKIGAIFVILIICFKNKLSFRFTKNQKQQQKQQQKNSHKTQEVQRVLIYPTLISRVLISQYGTFVTINEQTLVSIINYIPHFIQISLVFA